VAQGCVRTGPGAGRAGRHDRGAVHRRRVGRAGKPHQGLGTGWSTSQHNGS
jgi:hypothetical protein